jgi:hypothetical protein
LLDAVIGSIFIHTIKNYIMNWNLEKNKKPKFGELVLVYCKTYGRFLASYEQIEDTDWGNWSYNGDLGILPPIYWMSIPEIPTGN